MNFITRTTNIQPVKPKAPKIFKDYGNILAVMFLSVVIVAFVLTLWLLPIAVYTWAFTRLTHMLGWVGMATLFAILWYPLAYLICKAMSVADGQGNIRINYR